VLRVAQAMAPPASLQFEGKDVPLWTYSQLEKLSKSNLRNRAQNLRDQIGEERLVPLRLSAQPPALIRWLLVAQCTLCEVVGLSFVTLKDWGAPEDVGNAGETEPYFGQGGPRPPTRDQQTADAAMMPPPPPPPGAEMMYAMPPPGAEMHAMPPYGYDAQQQQQMPASPHHHQPPMAAEAPPTPSQYAQLENAHQDAMAGARAARARNTGTFSFGGDPEPSPRTAPARAPPPHIPQNDYYMQAPPSSRGNTPRQGGPPIGGYQHYSAAEQRPGSAASMAATEDSASARERFRVRNQGSFAFG